MGHYFLDTQYDGVAMYPHLPSRVADPGVSVGSVNLNEFGSDSGL